MKVHCSRGLAWKTFFWHVLLRQKCTDSDVFPFCRNLQNQIIPAPVGLMDWKIWCDIFERISPLFFAPLCWCLFGGLITYLSVAEGQGTGGEGVQGAFFFLSRRGGCWEEQRGIEFPGPMRCVINLPSRPENIYFFYLALLIFDCLRPPWSVG